MMSGFVCVLVAELQMIENEERIFHNRCETNVMETKEKHLFI